MKYFGENLKYLRKSSGMTQAEIKDGLDIEATTWGNYERGQSFPNLNLFSQIVKYFGISADDLLYKNLTNVHLIEKKEVQKNQENVHLNVHPNVHLTDEIGGKKVTIYGDEIPFNPSLNEAQMPYMSVPHQINQLSNKIATLEANMSNKISEIEDKIKALQKHLAKK